MNETNGQAPKQTYEYVDAAFMRPSVGSFGDLEHKTNSYLEKIRYEARKIVEDTRAEVADFHTKTSEIFEKERVKLQQLASELEARKKRLDVFEEELNQRCKKLENEAFEQARSDGFKEGFDNGVQDGIKEAKKDFQKQVDQEVAHRLNDLGESALVPLHKLITEMLGARRALLKNWEENIMQVAAAIAYQTIMRNPAIEREVPLDLLREALELAMNCATLKIRMNPMDINTLSQQINVLLEETGNLAKSEIVPDSKISRGGCVVESSLGIVDERLESRLERIVAELSE